MINRVKYFVARFNQYAVQVEGISKIRLFVMWLYSYLRFGCTIRDFFIYRFYLMNDIGKSMYIPSCVLMKLYSKINISEYAKILIDKEETLHKFRCFMKRSWCGAKYSSLEDFELFKKENDKCIFKPCCECGGHGIELLDISNMSAEELKNKCESFPGGALIEELIVQHEDVSRLYAGSVNTIRLITVDKNIIAAVLRIGSGGSVIDNASSGGMFADVDIDTGIITSKAITYNNDEYIKHPDTGEKIIGYQIPMWDDVKKFVLSAINVLPQLRIVGWDVAVTPNGPTFVEVNEGPDFALHQQNKRVGVVKPLIDIKSFLK